MLRATKPRMEVEGMERDIVCTDVTPEKARNSVRLTRREWIALAGACALAAGFVYGWMFSDSGHLPGIGWALSAWGLLALCLLLTGMRHLRRSWFPLIAAALLAGCYGIFADDALRLMNFPVLVGLAATAAYSLAGGKDVLAARGLLGSARRLFAGTFPHFLAPLQALSGLRAPGGRRNLVALLLGLALCVPVVGAAALLLCDADAAFAALLEGLFAGLRFESLPVQLVKLAFTLLLTLMLFAFLYGLTRWTEPKPRARRFIPSALTLGMVLVALGALYAAFLWVQFRSLRALPESYARSARAGFFQLVLVALLTLLVALPSLSLRPDSRPLRVLAALVTLLTVGILASAAWRMALYIGEYGWTLLRMVTLWGMLAIAAALLAALAKCARPGLRVCRGLAIFAIVTWLAFNYVNVDERIAELNVAAHRSGAREVLDAEYLAQLSPDVLPALRGLVAEEPEYIPALREVEETFRASAPRGYDWALCWRVLDAPSCP